MKSCATKICHGSGSRFDPLLEEKRGWIYGEARRHDVEMSDAVIEVMAEASKQILVGELNSFKEQIGEILLSNLENI